MKLGTKVTLIAVLSIVVLNVVIITTSSHLALAYVNREEKRLIEDHYKNAEMVIYSEKHALQRTLLDWSRWDSTYNFIQNRNQAYVDENLGMATMDQLGLCYMGFFDQNLRTVIGIYDDKLNNKIDTSLLVNWIQKEKSSEAAYKDPIIGITYRDGKVFLIGAAPITPSDGQAVSNGYLVMEKPLNNSFISYLESLLDVSISINKASNSIDFKLSDAAFNKENMIIHRYERQIESSAQISDILDQKPIVFTFNMERKLYSNARYTLFLIEIICFFVFATIIAVNFIIFDRLAIRRVKKLSDFVDGVIESKDTTARIRIPGGDELSRLAGNMNTLLGKLDEMYVETTKNDERLRLIMDATNDGFFDVNLISRSMFINSSWLKHTGYTHKSTQLKLEECLRAIYSEDRGLFDRAFRKYISGRSEKLEIELRGCKASGEILWILIRGRAVAYDDKGAAIRFIGTLSDITLRKNAEERNLYLMQTDTVTQLKNRKFMEDLLKKAYEKSNNNLCIVMADVNGLKLVNDTFGHKEGDRMLSVFGDVFRLCCEANDIPVRWGGDEFMILVEGKSITYAEDLVQKIKYECSKIDSFPLKLSIAMGCASRDEKNNTMDEIIKLAEERMYRNKIMESRSIRNATISSLEQLLHEKDTETEDHRNRVSQMCKELGQDIGLTQDEMDELALLSIFHDIGTIAIPDNILSNPTLLSEEEQRIMMTHTEIGYRIAKATPDLVHIADKILSHHERYDGKGYPQGLLGSTIPKIVRLLAIVDFFDIMTHHRSYKKALSTADAVQEIQKGSGTNFDPVFCDVFIKYVERSKSRV